MSGALADPLSVVASRLRQYDILCKVLRLLPEAVDVEPVGPVEPLHEIIARMNLDNTPYLQPTVEAEEIRDEAGRVWTRQLKTIDERLRWKLESDLVDIWGLAHVEGMYRQKLKATEEYQEAVLTNSRDAWIAFNLVFSRLNADVQLKRTNADDAWGLDFKWKMETFTHELAQYASALRSDIDNYNAHTLRPVHSSNPSELKAHFLRLLICVFDDGLMRGATRDAYGAPDSWVRNPPKSDPSNWRNDILNDAPFISWLTVAAWKVLAEPDSFSDPYNEYQYEGGMDISREAQQLRQESRDNGASEQTLNSMTELIVDMAKANLGRTATPEKLNFEYNRHYHTQLSALLKLMQPFEAAVYSNPTELQALVMPRINARIADTASGAASDDSIDARLWHVLHAKFDKIGRDINEDLLQYCDIFYLDTITHMGPWVAHHIRDWLCEFRDLLIEMCVTIMKYKAARASSWSRSKRHYRMVTLLLKLTSHMYDVPTQHTGNMSYQAYKDPFNKRVKFLQHKEWMKLLEDTSWIVFCADYSGIYDDATYYQHVNPRVGWMIGAYRAALETREQNTPADQLVNFAKAQTETEDPSVTTRPATAPARSTLHTPPGERTSATHATRNALLELQALYTVQI